MNPKDRLGIINSIALHLQEEYNTSGINMLLEGYGIKTENITSVSSKRTYVIDLLKSEKKELLINIAKDLKLEIELPITKSTKKSNMKIFISHSSKNANYGNALVQLLTGIGINSEQIIFTSNSAFGIPIGQNIFNWLKDRINEKPYVIYLLSPEYYSSVACLNEMGAAWVIENQHSMIFTPNFKLDSYEFQNGALDPREIGFYINDEDRLTGFIESLKEAFEISPNQVLINQKCRDFIQQLETFPKAPIISSVTKETEKIELNTKSDEALKPKTEKKSSNNAVNRYFNDLNNGKLKDEEVLIIQYVIDTARYKLGTGWQESNEQENIKVWEDLNELNNTLSQNYSTALRRLDMRKLIEVSDVTSHGNPKEYQFIEEMQNELLDLPQEFHNKVIEIKERISEDCLPF